MPVGGAVERRRFRAPAERIAALRRRYRRSRMPAAPTEPLVASESRPATKRVLLHVGRLAHPFYREQIRVVPDGFEYVPGHPDLLAEEQPKRDLVGAGTLSQAARTQLTRAADVART